MYLQFCECMFTKKGIFVFIRFLGDKMPTDSFVRRLTRRFKPKPKAFIIFTDLDGTFTPIGLEGLKDFAQAVTEITQREKVQVLKAITIGKDTVYHQNKSIFR